MADDPQLLLLQIQDLERYVDGLDSEADTRELLGAVAELRAVRARYADSTSDRRAFPDPPDRRAFPDPPQRYDERFDYDDRFDESWLGEEPRRASPRTRRDFVSASAPRSAAPLSASMPRPRSAFAKRSHPQEVYDEDARRDFVSTAPLTHQRRGLDDALDDDAFGLGADDPFGDFVNVDRRGGSEDDSPERQPASQRPTSARRASASQRPASSARPASSSRPTSARLASSSRPASASQRPGYQRDPDVFGEGYTSRGGVSASWAHRTAPLPFSNLEADVQDRQFKHSEQERLRQSLDAEEVEAKEARFRRSLAVKPGGFKGIEEHQREQNERAAAKRKSLQAQAAVEKECMRFRAVEAQKGPSRTLDEAAMDEVGRGARIQRRAEASLRLSSAPGAGREPVSKRPPAEESAKPPRAKTLEPAEITRQNDAAHERWLRSLDRSKRQGRSCTEPKDPLEARRLEQQERSAERSKAKRDREASEAAEKAKTALKQRARAALPTHTTARQTYSSYLKSQSVRERQNAARADALKLADEAQQRAQRQRDVSRRLAQELKFEDGERTERLQGSAAPSAQQQRKDFAEKLRFNKKRIAAAADAAPSLMSRLNITSARDKARVAALKKVSATVYGATSSADWRHVVEGADIFDAQDKLFLNIQDDGHAAAAAADDDDDDEYS
ncbi:hypothetical protein M885DRAFT_624235 [Pelagophyceae sp. CCMP2097]|nr:hypothetical protein M885DRAFT_624235 [Pelagophyceae sp. CCMP2097]